jgi:CheY-like chemotaxis protein
MSGHVSAQGNVAQGRKVLVVDDNEDAARMLALMLSLEGHEVQTAFGGAEALAAVETFKPETVFLDIALPGMDGYEVARRLRRTPGLVGVTLVAMTGFSADEDLQRARAAGFDHHLVKPADPAEVMKLLQRG